MEQTYKDVLQSAQIHFTNSLFKLYKIGNERATPDMFKYNVQYTVVSAQEDMMRVMFGNTIVDELIENAYQTYYKTNE
jgi:hypothetical protein